jgi:hypothetical protein
MIPPNLVNFLAAKPCQATLASGVPAPRCSSRSLRPIGLVQRLTEEQGTLYHFRLSSRRSEARTSNAVSLLNEARGNSSCFGDAGDLDLGGDLGEPGAKACAIRVYLQCGYSGLLVFLGARLLVDTAHSHAIRQSACSRLIGGLGAGRSDLKH